MILSAKGHSLEIPHQICLVCPEGGHPNCSVIRPGERCKEIQRKIDASLNMAKAEKNDEKT